MPPAKQFSYSQFLYGYGMCMYLYLVTFFHLSHLNLFVCLLKLQIAIAANFPFISNALAGGPEKDRLSYSSMLMYLLNTNTEINPNHTD